jgi:ATP-dependent Clp protease adaptor protein ClpS
MTNAGFDTEQEPASRTEEETIEPSMYRVMLHNDDYTTMAFVVQILLAIFHKSIEDATRIMLKVHTEGIGLCGIYPHDVAETKVSSVLAAARDNGFPLKCTMEEDEQ